MWESPAEHNEGHTNEGLSYTCRQSISVPLGIPSLGRKPQTGRLLTPSKPIALATLCVAFLYFSWPFTTSVSDSLVILRFGTPAPLPSTSTLATSHLLPITLGWRRSHKRKVHFNSLVQQLGIMCAFDGGFGFLLRRVLD